jgi:uncharacterized phage protein gp47/JayE
MLLKRIPNGKANKEKSLTFAENIMKKRAWVPGPANYSKIENWSTSLPKNSGKFSIKPRITIAGEIYVKSQKYNVPSPSDYNSESWRHESHQVRQG